MAKFLTQEWLDLQVELTKDLPTRPGVTARTQYKVTGTPDGDVTFHRVIDDGKLVEGALGDDASADASYTVTYNDFVNAAKGDLDTNALFMQGKLKMVGSTATLLTLMPLTQSSEYKAMLQKVDAATEY